MRASRLLSILTTLQARGRVTAQVLAEECEVSLRTIYRDVDALSAAGIPVYSERGSAGGYRLLDGYRTRLNGLSAREAEALFLTGLSGPAADLGLGAAMAAAQLKLLVAMPADLRAGAERMRARFHLDAPAWFGEAEQPANLQLVAGAVWKQLRIRMRYRSWKAERERIVEPLGLVLKGGAWYLVGRCDGTPEPIGSAASSTSRSRPSASSRLPRSTWWNTGGPERNASRPIFTRTVRSFGSHPGG